MKSTRLATLIGGWLLAGIALAQQPAAPAAAQDGSTAPAAQDSFAAVVAQLPEADFATKRELLGRLASLRNPNIRPLLVALLEGRVYSRDADHKVFTAVESAGQLQLTDAISGQGAGSFASDGYTAVGSNNQLRKALRAAIAQYDLSSEDAGVRLAAVQELLRSVDAETVAVLRARVATEPAAKVRSAMAAAIALADLGSDAAATRLSAIGTLRHSLNPDVYNRLKEIADSGTAEAPPSEPDAEVRSAAFKAVASIERWRDFYGVIETLFFGLSLGSVLVLAGIGLAVTFGVMGIINMAHGELMMLGAYTVYVVQQLMPHAIGASILVAIPLAFIVSGAVGVLIERCVVRFLYGRPLETLLATFGVSLILQQLVRDVFSPNNRPVETPEWMAGSLAFNDVLSITWTRLYIVLFTLAVFALLLLVLKRTRLGLEVRAVAQNRAMAKAMGIRTEWVDAFTFGLGSGIAGVAGVALSQLTNVGPNLGQSYIVDSFMVVVFGGVGSLWGTQIGGTSLGVVNKLLEPWVGAVLAKILVLVFLILFIQRRPRGLFPQRGRAAEG
jgi:urea transport system permease protein